MSARVLQYFFTHTKTFLATEYEANFLKLLDILTDGSRIEVNESGNE